MGILFKVRDREARYERLRRHLLERLDEEEAYGEGGRLEVVASGVRRLRRRLLRVEAARPGRPGASGAPR